MSPGQFLPMFLLLLVLSTMDRPVPVRIHRFCGRHVNVVLCPVQLSYGLSAEYSKSSAQDSAEKVDADRQIYAKYYVSQIMQLGEEGIRDAWSKVCFLPPSVACGTWRCRRPQGCMRTCSAVALRIYLHARHTCLSKLNVRCLMPDAERQLGIKKGDDMARGAATRCMTHQQRPALLSGSWHVGCEVFRCAGNEREALRREGRATGVPVLARVVHEAQPRQGQAGPRQGSVIGPGRGRQRRARGPAWCAHACLFRPTCTRKRTDLTLHPLLRRFIGFSCRGEYDR